MVSSLSVGESLGELVDDGYDDDGDVAAVDGLGECVECGACVVSA